MKSNFLRKYIFLFFVLIAVSSVFVFATGKKDRTALYSDLIKTGTLNQIRQTLVSDENFSKTTDGVTADNLLMQALALKREPKIIISLLDAGILPTQNNAENQNAVMYACAYSDSPEVIKAVITRGVLTKKSVRKRLLQRDSYGLNAIDYSYQLNKSVAPNAIRPYLTPDLIIQYEGSIPDDYVYEPEFDDTEIETFIEEPPLPTLEETIEPHIPVAPLSQDVLKMLSESDLAEKPYEDPARVRPVTERTYLFDDVDPEAQKTSALSPESALTYIHDADAANAKGQTRLMQACAEGDMFMVSSLLFSGAKVNETDNDGWTALMYAARYQNDSRIIQALLAAGANTSLKNNFGLSALAIAATYSRSEEVVYLLLNSHKRIDDDMKMAFIYSITTPTGKTVPFQIRVTEMFLNKGLDINFFWKGKTPLMYVAQTASSTEIISTLLARGARKDISSSEGKTAFYYAEQNINLPRDEIFWSLNSK